MAEEGAAAPEEEKKEQFEVSQSLDVTIRRTEVECSCLI
jgi:hypothetical protein